MAGLDIDVKRLYGVGAVRAANYQKIGIRTVDDLLSYYPRGYENRADVRLLCDHNSGAKTSVVLTVGTVPTLARLKNRMTLVKFKAFDESGVCEITYFNQEYLKNVFVLGEEFRFYGIVKPTRSGYSMAQS